MTISLTPQAIQLADEVNANNDNIEVYAYSSFYPFYEQYDTIVRELALNLVVCIIATFLVATALLGFNFEVGCSLEPLNRARDSRMSQSGIVLQVFSRGLHREGASDREDGLMLRADIAVVALTDVSSRFACTGLITGVAPSARPRGCLSG